MARFRLLVCILCLLFSVTFLMAAKESDVDSEMHDVESEAKMQTNSSIDQSPNQFHISSESANFEINNEIIHNRQWI